jgi:hypothetical protein
MISTLVTRTKMEVIHEDRRGDRRYPIELELRYKMVARNRNPMQGAGRTSNISSGGILFDGNQILPAGSFVELSIDWPVLLHNTRPLTLMIVGRVVRCDGGMIAIKTNRYEFLTRAIRSVPDTAGQHYIA